MSGDIASIGEMVSIGASLDDPSSPLAYAGVAGIIGSALLGAWVGRRAWKALRA